VTASGREAGWLPDILFPFQRKLVEWACKKGRAAIFADCGLGKTFMQLVWAENMRQGNPALIVAPLGVTTQTIDEAKKIGLDVQYLPEPAPWDGIAITNYERIKPFAQSDIAALVLDESSILKSVDGKTRSLLTERFQHVPARLCCTATPAPNDLVELGNHSQFLGYMTAKEMQAMFFINRAQTGSRWDLKQHGANSFYRWLASWGMFLRQPSDIGFGDDGFILPRVSIEQINVPTDFNPAGQLFPTITGGIQGRLEARRKTINQRVDAVARLVEESPEQWVVWCGLNDEGRELKKRLDGAALVEGADPPEKKISSWHRWRNGEAQTMISKPSIFGFGMNFQFCHNVAFLGLGDSYEQYYQAIRRCWRFGQNEQVNVHVVVSDIEGPIVENVKRKETTAQETNERMISVMADYEKQELAGKTPKIERAAKGDASGPGWNLTNGDAVEWLPRLAPESIDFSVFSPPFLDLYAYTDSDRDIGNSRGAEEYYKHYGFVIDGLLAATKPGRLCATHVSQIPAIKYVDGFIGLKDFRGQMVEEYVKRGWIYHGECVIDKNPQAQAIRTKAKGLLFASLKRDSSWLRPALADYILLFRKPGDNAEPIKPTDISHEDWISWAHPIWYGIDETKVLQFRHARGPDDVKHICPLQLDVIERCIKLWSNPGDLVCSPFAGVGSEGFMAMRLGRKFTGCELKREYFKVAARNIEAGVSQLELDLKTDAIAAP
jgi:DNA modification methylase